MSTITPTRCRIFAEYFGKAPPYTHRSVSVRPSFTLRSSFVRPSFVLRSTFVRPSFGLRSGSENKRRQNEDKATKQQKTKKLKTLKPKTQWQPSKIKSQISMILQAILSSSRQVVRLSYRRVMHRVRYTP